MGKEGVLPTLADMFCQAGQRELDQMELGDVYVVRVESLRDLIEVYDREVAMLEARIHRLVRDDPGYQHPDSQRGRAHHRRDLRRRDRRRDALPLRGGAVLVGGAGAAPPRVRHQGRAGGITKMGSRLVRWAALEAIVRYHGGSWLQRDFHRIADRRGKNKARVAVARKLLTLVYYGLRDGEIRCLREPVAA
jgi:hypothetical protein